MEFVIRHIKKSGTFKNENAGFFMCCVKFISSDTKMQIPEKLLDYLQPSLWSLDAAHLDAGQCLIQLLCDRSHLGHAAREADLVAVVYDLADRGDNSSGTAETALSEIFYFCKRNRTLLCL